MKAERQVLAFKPPRANAQQAAPTSGDAQQLFLRISANKDQKGCFPKDPTTGILESVFVYWSISCCQLSLRMQKTNARSRNRQWLPCPWRKKDRLLSPTHISLQRVVSHRFVSQSATWLPADPHQSGRWKRTMTMTRMTPVRFYKLKLTLSKYKSSSLTDISIFFQRSHTNCCVSVHMQPLWDVWSSASFTSRRTMPCTVVLSKQRYTHKTTTPDSGEMKLNRARQGMTSWYTCHTAVKMLHDQTRQKVEMREEKKKTGNKVRRDNVQMRRTKKRPRREETRWDKNKQALTRGVRIEQDNTTNRTKQTRSASAN